jgi:hypothetical protein
MLESIGELPSHPLFVHAVALFGLVLTLRPPWRQHAGPALPILSAGVALATFLAMRSGEALRELLGDFAPNTDKHESLAKTALILVLALVVTSAGMVLADRQRGGGSGLVAKVPLVLAGLSTGLAALATIWMFRAGHEGARLVWKGTVQSMAALSLT